MNTSVLSFAQRAHDQAPCEDSSLDVALNGSWEMRVVCGDPQLRSPSGMSKRSSKRTATVAAC